MQHGQVSLRVLSWLPKQGPRTAVTCKLGTRKAATGSRTPHARDEPVCSGRRAPPLGCCQSAAAKEGATLTGPEQPFQPWERNAADCQRPWQCSKRCRGGLHALPPAQHRNVVLTRYCQLSRGDLHYTCPIPARRLLTRCCQLSRRGLAPHAPQPSSPPTCAMNCVCPGGLSSVLSLFRARAAENAYISRTCRARAGPGRL